MTRARVKEALGRVPATAEAYQRVLASGKQPQGGYALDRLAAALPDWLERADHHQAPKTGQRVLVVASLPWWIEYGSAISLLLSAAGNEVTLAYVPYRTWIDPVQAFDRRRQSTYIRSALAPLRERVAIHDLAESTGNPLPDTSQPRGIPS